MKVVVLPSILFFIMFSMGLAMTITDFKNVAKFPKAFFVGGFLQLLSLPILGFLFAYLGLEYLGLSPELAVGMVIIAACPGAVFSNLLTHLAKGDTALSISLTSIVSIITVFSIPLIVNIGLFQFAGAQEAAQLALGKTTLSIFFITVIPVAIGMLVKRFKPKFALWLEPKARTAATGLFALVVLMVLVNNAKALTSDSAALIPLVIIFNTVAMCVAAYAAKMFSLNRAQSTAITFECGLQNGTLAIVIALNILNNEIMMIPGAVYSVIMFVTALTYFSRIKKKTRSHVNQQSLKDAYSI